MHRGGTFIEACESLLLFIYQILIARPVIEASASDRVRVRGNRRYGFVHIARETFRERDSTERRSA
jgi:hypothetical protein